jgi:hypothetical protein
MIIKLFANELNLNISGLSFVESLEVISNKTILQKINRKRKLESKEE